MVWTVKKVIAAAKRRSDIQHRPVSARYDYPCALVRVTKTGKVREGFNIYEDRSICRNDIDLHLVTKLRPADIAYLWKLEL